MAVTVKEIQLTQGYVAMVDDEDFERVNKHNWHAIVSYKTSHVNVYAVRGVASNGTVVRLWLHKVILNTLRQVDHIDNNGLNNCRSNLRECTTLQNIANSRKRANTISKYKGVHRLEAKCVTRPWQARLGQQHLGTFATEEDAAKAYDVAAVDRYGEFAKPNFKSSTVS